MGENTQTNLPWVEKYRPKRLEDLISHEDILKTIKRFMDENRLPHLLLYGPPGTGKTSTILACARQLYKGKEFNSMVLELNASDDRGIGVVRNQIMNFASTRTIFSKGFKLIILDEADAMTKDAQNALRRVMEKFTENVRFCLICNYLTKIIPAIQSRCTRFRFGPLTTTQMKPTPTPPSARPTTNSNTPSTTLTPIISAPSARPWTHRAKSPIRTRSHLPVTGCRAVT